MLELKKILTDNRITELSNRIHTMNVEKGFWYSGTRDIQQIVMLNISEISEALESHRKGEQAIFVEDDKPEGWVVEIADCAIRILDAIGGIEKINFNATCKDPIMQFLYDTTVMSVNTASVETDKSLNRMFSESKENCLANLKQTLFMIDITLEEKGFNLLSVIEQKLEYNATRAHKHGKNY